MTRQSLALPLALVLGCNDAGEATPIPESLRGAYGRSDADAYYTTLGLEVDVDTLRFSELRLKITGGKDVGNDSYQVSSAELRWVKDDKPPRKCKGSIARQDPRLLLSLFREESDAPCDSTLDGEWAAWKPITEIPAGLHGVYGRGSVYASAEGVRIEAGSITIAGADSGLELVKGVAYEGRDDHMIVREANYHGRRCRGAISVKEDRLSGKLDVVEGEAPDDKSGKGRSPAEDRFVGYLGSGDGCPPLFGERWTIESGALPDKPVTNGRVKVEFQGATVTTTTTDEQGLRCEQAILRTATRKVRRSGRDGIPVMGGTVVVLTPGAPSKGVGACAARLKNLAAAECESLMGMPCAEDMLSPTVDDHPDVRCPTHLVVGDPTGDGRKIAVLPQTVQNAVCFEMTGHFTGG